MHRTFETTTERPQRTLDGSWEFVTDPADQGVEEGYYESFPSEVADRIAVPSAWNARPEYADFVGPAWFRRTFDLDSGGAVLFTFHAVAHEATVWQFCDTLANQGDAMSRPRSRNNKGILTEYRTPKDGYRTLSERLDEHL